MPLKKIVSLFIFILLIIGGAVFFFQNQAKKEVSPPSKPEATIQEVNFSKNGVIKKDETGDWIFLYEEPGRLAITAKIKLSKDSLCNFGSGENSCDASKWKDGIPIKISGNLKDDELEVLNIERQE